MIRDFLDPRHDSLWERLQQWMVGLRLLRRSCFLPSVKKRRETALPLEEGEDLQDAVARRPREAPPPLHKPLKFIHHFLI